MNKFYKWKQVFVYIKTNPTQIYTDSLKTSYCCRSFFNRTFLCSTHAWTCSLTGVSALTYAQALESEREAKKLVDGLADCYKQASLELIHHAPRTNMKTLAEEICLFYRDRFVVGEVVDMTVITSSGAK